MIGFRRYHALIHAEYIISAIILLTIEPTLK
jgi:hypothetical protein